MSSTVNIGTLEGLLRWKADDAELTKSLADVAQKANVSQKQVKQYNTELKSITSSYERVAASLDPVTANTQKYDRAERSLSTALKAGIISQEQHNRVLAQAKEKYLSSSASTLTWREEIQRLTNVMGPLGGKVSGLLSGVDGLKSALLGSTAATTSASGAATAATGSFTTLYAAAAPLIAALAALALAAGGVYVAFKSFSFLSDAVSKGVETQLVIEKLNITLQATGSYAQLSSAQLVTLAESYELLSGKSKEEIIAAETILARFETLNSRVYPEALKAVLAYSKAMGVTAEAAAGKLGPALEGNTRALASLKEAGIVLSAGQRKTLQDMVEGGKVAEYQAKLLEILRQKVGELSNEYDNNLSRQGQRARIVLDDFAESIANQVIPAIEDLVTDIVNSLGGWDALKAKVNEVGSAIGNFIRTSIYGLMIAYHELMATVEALVSITLSGFSKIAKAHGVLRGSISSLMISSKLSAWSEEAASGAISHAESVTKLSKRLAEHRVALEGNTTVYQANGSALDGIIAKNQELARLTDELTDIYQEQSLELERIYALRMLATTSPDKETRLAQEKAINEAHKERILFLKQEEKFGTAIAESLAKQRKELKDLELKAKIELDISTKIGEIKIDQKAIDKLFDVADNSYKLAMDRLSDTIAVDQKNQAEFQKSRDEYADWVEGVANDWKEHFRSMGDVANDEIGAVKLAVQEGAMTVAEGERAIAEIRANYYSVQVDQWSGFVGQIAGMLLELGGSFGHFMSQIVSAAQSIQGVNQTANSLGGWSTAMGAWGGTIAAFVELYKFADSVIQKHKGEKYGTRGSVSVTGGYEVPSYLNQGGMELTRGISDVLKAFEDSLRISVTDLQSIEIRVRNNGQAVQAYVKGVWIGTFTDVQTAIREALMVAIQDPSSSLRGLSDIMAEGLSRWTSPDMEGLLDFLTTLRSISDLSLSPLVIDLHKSFIAFNEMREALNKLDQSSQAVIKAQNELADAQNYLYSQTKAQLLGIDLSAADAIRNLAGFQKGMVDVSETARVGLESALKAAQGRLEALERAATGLPNGGMGGAGVAGPQDSGTQVHDIVTVYMDGIVGAIDDQKSSLKAAIEEYKRQLAEVPKALSDMELKLGVYDTFKNLGIDKLPKYASLVLEMEKEKVKLQFEQFKMQLVILGVWAQWEGAWKDLYNQAMAEAGKSPVAGRRGGGGSGSGNRGEVRDFIKDTKFELSLVGLTEYQKALKELEKVYDEQIEKAGKNKKLVQELLDLKRQELELLRREQAEATRGKFREFLGLITPFDKVRKTATDLIKEINGSPFGNAQKAAMVGRVMAELDKQLNNLAKSMTVDLFGSMISDMERFGATDLQMQKAKEAMAILQHELTMADYALRIAQLEAEGRVSAETLATLHGAYDFLAGIKPEDWIKKNEDRTPANDNFSSYSGGNAFDEFETLLKSVQDKLAEWARVPLSPTLTKAHEMTESFDKLMADVQKLIPKGWDYRAIAKDTFTKMVKGFINDTLGEFESTGSELGDLLAENKKKFDDFSAAFTHLGASQEDLARLESARLSETKKILSQWLDPIKEYRLGRTIGERSTLTGEQQFFAAQKQFREMFAKIQSGDLSQLGDVVTLASQYEKLMTSFTGGEGLRFGLKEIDDALLSIETLVPGFAGAPVELGTSGNPMIVNNQEMIKALEDNEKSLNNGNDLILKEMREELKEIRDTNSHLSNIEVALSQTISVRNVA